MEKSIKQDINFLENPLWMQTAKKPNRELVIWEDNDGYVFEAARGVPGKVDVLILYSLLLECQNNNWSDTLYMSRYQILKGCDMNVGKPEQERLKQALEAWKRVTISFSGTFYSGKAYHYMEFGIIDDWGIRKEDHKIEIRLNRKWIEKIRKSEFFKYVSFVQMRSLRSPLALRLYEILIKVFYKRTTWEIDALKLAEKIPMAEKYFSDIAPKIEAATKRISDKTDLNIVVEVIREGRGKGKFYFKKIDKQKPYQQNLFPEFDEKELHKFRAMPLQDLENLSLAGNSYAKKALKERVLKITNETNDNT